MNKLIKIVAVLVLLSTAACTPDLPEFGAFPTQDDDIDAAMSKDAATAIGVRALEGINTRSFAAFSEGWAPSMRDAIGEDDWLAYRDELVAAYGAFEHVVETRITWGDTEGYVRFSMLAEFEHDYLSFINVYPIDGTAITGAFFRDPETGELP